MPCWSARATLSGRPARPPRATACATGTAGNGYAFLKLYQRTGDPLRLDGTAELPALDVI
jgi:hypothetical protein